MLVDNRDLKATAGTPLSNHNNTMVSGLTIQRTAVVFSNSIFIVPQITASHFSKGLTLKNSRLLPLIEEGDFHINSPEINIYYVFPD